MRGKSEQKAKYPCYQKKLGWGYKRKKSTKLVRKYCDGQTPLIPKNKFWGLKSVPKRISKEKVSQRQIKRKMVNIEKKKLMKKNCIMRFKGLKKSKKE